MSDTPTRQATDDTPLQDLSHCHVGFVTVLEAALGLPEMIVTPARSRSCAAISGLSVHEDVPTSIIASC